jgi:hypothetical protein
VSGEKYVPPPVRMGWDPLHREYITERRSYFNGPPTAEDAAKLDRLGETLEKLFALERQKIRTQRELVRIYRADCKRLGIEPRKIDTHAM